MRLVILHIGDTEIAVTGWFMLLSFFGLLGFASSRS